METVVLDACVAVKWYVFEDGRDLALRLLDSESLVFIAPDIFGPEVLNALLKNNREGHLSDALFEDALFDLRTTSPEQFSTIRLMDRAVEIARGMRHGIYDCLYLALAERWDTKLVTADAAFVRRCRSRPHASELADRIVTLDEFVR